MRQRSLKALRAEADGLAASRIKAVGRCAAEGHQEPDGSTVRCSTRHEWCHLKSKGILFLRHSLKNASCLCNAHHRHYTTHPDHWYLFIEETRPGTWDYLNEQIKERRATKKKVPLREVFTEAIEFYRGLM